MNGPRPRSRRPIRVLFVTLLVVAMVGGVLPPAIAAEEVPFGVVSTYVTAEASDVSCSGCEATVSNGVLVGWDGFDSFDDYGKPVVPVLSVDYRIEFWNVGAMTSGEERDITSDSAKATLTRTYVLGQAYTIVEGDDELVIFDASLTSAEIVEVPTPEVQTTFVDEILFTGGPNGLFLTREQNGDLYGFASISDGAFITFNNLPEGEQGYLMDWGRASQMKIPITDAHAFEKWMKILNRPDVEDTASTTTVEEVLPTTTLDLPVTPLDLVSQEACDPDDPRKDSGIRFSDYHGEVMVRPDCDEDAWYGAELGMVLYVDDHVRTGDDSTCVLSLADMTTFVMKPESEIVLSTPPTRENKLKLIWGKIKVNVRRMLKDGTMDVEMSQAVAGIKGTIFVAEESGEASTLKVIEGVVEFTSRTTGEIEMVGPGESITATEQGLGEKVAFDVDTETRVWDEVAAGSFENVESEGGAGTPLAAILGILFLLMLSVGYLVIRKRSHQPEDGGPSGEEELQQQASAEIRG